MERAGKRLSSCETSAMPCSAASRIDVYADAGQIHAIRLLRRRIAEEHEAAGRLVA